MPGEGLDNKVQGLVLAIESGWPARVVKWLALFAAIVGIALVQLVVNFKGISEPEAMEQATLARELASGNGFATLSIRPLAVWQLQSNGREIPRVHFPETYHVPLNSMVNSIPFFLLKKHWGMDVREVVYVMDRVVAGIAVCFFILSVIVWFFVARRLFDAKLAILGCGLIIVCDLMWQFSLSGLPHMLLLFLFSAASFCMVQAVFAKSSGTALGIWLGLYGLFCGLMALTQPLTVWMFAGGLAFIAFTFKPRFLLAGLVAVAFGIVVAPWLIRNFQVTGNPFGVAIFSALDGVKGSEMQWMRSLDPDFTGLGPGAFRSKLQDNFTTQIGNLVALLGWSFVAPVFFVSLLHSFKLSERGLMRWFVLLSWLGAVAGMTIFGGGDKAVGQDQLYVLFIPLMTFYGLAFLLILWSRLPIDYRFIRIAFFTLLYIICAIPLIIDLIPGGKGRLHWPPYVPPFIGILGQWYAPGEIIASDMSWAVGWYARRKSLLLPSSPQNLINVSDYNLLGGPVTGLYLTPITGRRAFLSEIVRGEFAPWAAFILRNPNLQNFPLQQATALPIDNECILFADRIRWQAAQTVADTEELTGQTAPEGQQKQQPQPGANNP